MLLPKLTARNRRHPLAAAFIVFLALLMTGTAYAALTPKAETSASATATGDAQKGEALFQANCATCHGPQATGRDGVAPSLVGVGAAAVDFQVGTGRMPMGGTAPQAPRKKVQFNDQQIADMAAYVASLGPGPGVPNGKALEMVDDPEALAEGGEIFRTNCAMCHNVVGAGGALTRGKWAPKLQGVESKHIYEAMATGPQSMPVFSDSNLTPEKKQRVISYLKTIEEQPSPGGIALGSLGPVSEGLFAWLGGMVAMIGFACWLGSKAV